MGLRFAQVNHPFDPSYLDGWQRHHLVPHQLKHAPTTASFFDVIARHGFRFDDFGTNGILLPATMALSRQFALPLHLGPHPRYNRRIAALIQRIARKYRDFALNPRAARAALSHVRLLQGRVRLALRTSGETQVFRIDHVDLSWISVRSLALERAIDTLIDSLEESHLAR